jgi:hypothetical protein
LPFHGADARYILLHDGIDGVQLGLQPGKKRVCPVQAESKASRDERKGADCHQPEIPVQAENAEHTSKCKHQGPDHAPDELRHEILHLGDVVGHPGHQRAGSVFIQLGKGKCHHFPKAVLAHVISHILGGHMDEHIVQRAAETAEEHQPDHLDAQSPDQA